MASPAQRPSRPLTKLARPSGEEGDPSMDDLSHYEMEFQRWIERELDIRFLPGKNLYENLESGQLLCRLLSHVKRDSINVHDICEFEDLFDGKGTPSREIYITRARRNVQLFMDACSRMGVKPLNSYFTFEDLYLQKNRSIICRFLLRLKEHLEKWKQKQQREHEQQQKMKKKDDRVVVPSLDIKEGSSVVAALVDSARVTSIPDDDDDDDDDEEMEQDDDDEIEFDQLMHSTASRISPARKPLPSPPATASPPITPTSSPLKLAINKVQQPEISSATPMFSRVDSGVFTLDSLKRKKQKQRALLSKIQFANVAASAFTDIAKEKERERQSLEVFQYPSDDEYVTLSTVIRAVVAVFTLPVVLVGVMFLNWRAHRSTEQENDKKTK